MGNIEEVKHQSSGKVAKNSFLQDAASQNISSGLISFTLIMTGPALMILQAAEAGHFTSEQTVHWIFSVYCFGGLFGIILPLLFRIPITGAHSISGVAFLATVTPIFTYPQLIGGYVLSSLIILLIGLSGVFTRVIKWVPKEVISAMLAGLVTNYVVQIVQGIKALPFIGVVALVSFLVGTKLSRRLPAVLLTVIAAFIALFLTEDLDITQSSLAFVLPALQMPEFSLGGLITIALPLALLVLSNDVAAGIGALESSAYEPPISKIVSLSGVFSLLASLFGGQSANIGGMMTAICSNPAAGEKSKRYVASIVSGILTILFGIFAWRIVPFIQSLPPAFVSMLAGFSLLGVLISSLQMGFGGGKYRLSAAFAFLIALSNVSFFHISAPVWGLLVGAGIAKLVED